ncbi:MAG: hypothetical protein R3D69_07195 [Xanthobacteraceae bacterium]
MAGNAAHMFAIVATKSGRGAPWTQRQTAATWLMQRGTDPWQAAGYLGMSHDVLLNTYGYHHPDYLSDAIDKITSRETNAERNEIVSEAVSVAVRKFLGSRGR